jgi:hypothetical protein
LPIAGGPWLVVACRTSCRPSIPIADYRLQIAVAAWTWCSPPVVLGICVYLPYTYTGICTCTYTYTSWLSSLSAASLSWWLVALTHYWHWHSASRLRLRRPPTPGGSGAGLPGAQAGLRGQRPEAAGAGACLLLQASSNSKLRKISFGSSPSFFLLPIPAAALNYWLLLSKSRRPPSPTAAGACCTRSARRHLRARGAGTARAYCLPPAPGAWSPEARCRAGARAPSGIPCDVRIPASALAIRGRVYAAHRPA